MAQSKYNEALSPAEQVDTEEAIASMIFDAVRANGPDTFDGVGEEEAAELGRKILKKVLKQFRPDLFGKRRAYYAWSNVDRHGHWVGVVSANKHPTAKDLTKAFGCTYEDDETVVEPIILSEVKHIKN